MAPRRRPPEPDEPSPERWIISYADVLTLLFALFAVLYAFSITDVVKAEQIVHSLRTSFGDEARAGRQPDALLGSVPITPVVTPRLPDSGDADRPAAAEREKLELLGKRVRSATEKAGAGRGVAVRRSEEGLVISLAATIFFDGDSTRVSHEASSAIDEVANQLLRVPNHVRVEGHTAGRGGDAISKARDWRVSSARAVAVLELLAAGGVPTHRLSASGFAAERPLMSSGTPEGRRANQRVDIVVLRASHPDPTAE